MTTIKLFISYSHDDIRPNEGRLLVLANALRSAGGNSLELQLDLSDQRAAIGASLPEFINLLNDADAVVVLLTPEYAKRVSTKGETGVYSEFRHIYERIKKAREDGTYGQSFTVLPVYFNDKSSDCCPPELNFSVAESLEWLQVTRRRNGSPVVRAKLQKQLRAFAADLIARTYAIAITKDKDCRPRQKALFRTFLFDDSKSSWSTPDGQKYLDSAFVKTSVFARASNHQVSFLVGRKGSGKSTITDVLPLLAFPRPAVVLAVDFENLPFELLFNILRSNPATDSDLHSVHSPISSYQLVWDVFFHMFYAWTIRFDLPDRCNLRQLLASIIDRQIPPGAGLKEQNALATRTIFSYVFEKLLSFHESILKSIASKEGIASVVTRFGPTSFRKHVFGQNAWKKLHSLLDGLSLDLHRVLITADGFDTVSAYFTKGSSDPEIALKFESELLLSLFQVVLQKGPTTVSKEGLYRYIDFCIAVPYARFDRARSLDHDRYEYRHRFARLRWSGIELSALIRKRLAVYQNVTDHKGPSQEDRLSLVMHRGFPELPEEISFQFGNTPYRMPLFLYILRHTFWRPRDVLWYYAALLRANDAVEKKGERLSPGFVRQVIAGATRYIVEDEFLEEFRETFPNLRQVLHSFREGPQILSWSELSQRLEQFKFHTNLFETKDSSTEGKVELLFNIGVLGVVLKKDWSVRNSVYRHAFCFNEDDLLSKLSRDDLASQSFALHPVFCEYLHLNTVANPELILPLDWKYLHENEVLRTIAPT